MQKASELSYHELNALIAQDQGWENVAWSPLGEHFGVPPAGFKGRLVSGLNVAWIPNYANDLNAIHEAVMTLGRKTPEYAEYCSHVNHIIAMELNTSCELLIQSITANARQRSEAYVIARELAKL